MSMSASAGMTGMSTDTGSSARNFPAPPLRWIGAHPRNFDRGRAGIVPEAVVLHIAEGSLAGMDAWFNNPTAGVSAHYGVGKAGEIHQYVAIDDTAFANGIVEGGYTARLIDENRNINPNRWTVAIEHEGRTGDLLTLAQFDVSTRLTAWLFQRYLLAGGASGVAVDRDHILMHRDITPRSRARCPGWGEDQQAAYIDRVRELLDPASDLNHIRELLDALTVQARALDEAAVRAEQEAARHRLQAARLRELIERFRG